MEPRKNIELYNIQLKFQHTPVHKKRSISYKLIEIYRKRAIYNFDILKTNT